MNLDLKDDLPDDLAVTLYRTIRYPLLDIKILIGRYLSYE